MFSSSEHRAGTWVIYRAAEDCIRLTVFHIQMELQIQRAFSCRIMEMNPAASLLLCNAPDIHTLVPHLHCHNVRGLTFVFNRAPHGKAPGNTRGEKMPDSSECLS